jgi:hypothetical protein
MTHGKLSSHGFYYATVLSLLFVYSGSIARAASYYVSSMGSDTNPGTQVMPFRTINKGLSILKSGDTLNINAGIYNESIYNNIPSGTSSAKTTVQGVGIGVILRPSVGTVSGNDVVTLVGKSHIILRNLVLDHSLITSSGQCLLLTGVSTYNLFENLEMKGAVHNGISINDRGGNYNTIRNCKIHDDGTSLIFGQCVYLRTAYNVIEGNTIYNCKGSGIQLYASRDDWPLTGNIIRGNFIHHTDDVGILAGNGNTNNTGIQIFNNILYKCGLKEDGGIRAFNRTFGMKILNNTIYVSNASSFAIWIDSTSSGPIVRNNLSWKSGHYYNKSATTISSNNLFNTIDPSFVNAAEMDFHLRSGSPAVDAGVSISTVTTDFDGKTRGNPPCIGAYEYP